MGSPVSVTAANLVMKDVEERALFTFDVELPFWKRYVVDTCTVVPIDRKDDLLTYLNQIEDSINIALEESEGRLAFLDVLMMHDHEDHGTISTYICLSEDHTY